MLFRSVVTAESALMYGNFIQTIIDFLIIAFFIFLALKVVMGLQGQINKIQSEFATMNNKERKAFIKTLKAEGKNKEEIATALAQREADMVTAAKIAEEKKIAEELANRPESTEAILKDIRGLLGGEAKKPKKKKD